MATNACGARAQPVLNTFPVMVLALGLKGIGSALSNNAIYPDLVLGQPDNPVLHATITAWWNAAYAVGWAAGPLLGGVLTDAFLLNNVCIGDQALQLRVARGVGPHAP